MCSSIGRARKKQKTYLVIADWCSGSTGVSEALSIRPTRVSATMLYEQFKMATHHLNERDIARKGKCVINPAGTAVRWRSVQIIGVKCYGSM